MQSERTPLRSATPAPNYVFMGNPTRVYRTKIRQFQCCICAAFLAVFVLAVVVTVSFSVNSDTEDKNKTEPTPPSDTDQQLIALFAQTWPLPDNSNPASFEPGPTVGELEDAIAVGQAGLTARELLEASSPSLAVNSPSYRHQKAVGTSQRATTLARAGFAMDIATRHIMGGRNVTKGSSIGRGPTLDADWLPQEVCRVSLDEVSSCPATPYRSVDGSCNNLKHPLQWGVAMRPFRRLLHPDYADGVSAPRVSSSGDPLPSARDVSVAVHSPLYRDDPEFTVMLAVWGQFIDHDITATALSQKSNGSSVSCCYAVQQSALKMHPECFPVRLAAGDPYYKTYNLTCMEFVRSAPAPTCSLGPREQLNQASSFLDASVVYGNTAELVSSLRRFESGELRMSVTEDGRSLLPISDDPNDGCNRAEMSAKGRYCFASGDSRANENMHLTTMHLLWARQHNGVASRLAKLNPTWDDERLYQETRRIVAAQMQHITYNEFLPIVLGERMMARLELSPNKTGYFTGYNDSIDPRIANSFAAASFRFAHTLIPGLMKVIGNDTSSEEYVEMHRILFNPFLLYRPGYLDGSLKGALDTDVLKVDPHVTSELSQHLFEQSKPKPSAAPAPCGLDLVSINIQRGRDHGLPSYPAWRERCGLTRPTSFADLKAIMDPESAQQISTLYKSVDDVDMYTGLLSEVPMDGEMLGPTLTCLLTDQFVRLKKADRYWYETPQQPQAFTPEQLDEVRKTTLAKVLCDTSDSVSKLQPLVMRTTNPKNVHVPCAELPAPDFSKWKEVDGSFVRTGTARVKEVRNRVRVVNGGDGDRVTASIDPGEPVRKNLAVGASVTGGRISTAEGVAWSGKLPLALPVPLFDSVANPGVVDTQTTDPPAYGHGILWDGSVTIDSYGNANLKGRFSMPKYIHGNGIANFSIKWVSGDFVFNTRVLWKTTLNASFVITGKYSSPVYLQQRKQYAYLKDPAMASSFHSFTDVSKDFVSNPAVQNDPTILRAPCILMGTYSEDRTMFLWSGNVTLVIPKVISEYPRTNAEFLSSPGMQDMMQLQALTSPVDPGKKKKKTTAIGVAVISGTVIANKGDSNSTTWWNGTFPAPIRIPAFNKVVTTAGASMLGNGISWNATITTNGTSDATISGNFSMPTYTNGAGSNFSIEWWNGNFSFHFGTLWNSSLDGLLLPGVTYSSPIYFRATKTIDTTEAIITDFETGENIMGDPTIQFITKTKSVIYTTPSVPIILHGTYSPDKTKFWWSGNAIIIIPATPTKSAVKAPTSSRELLNEMQDDVMVGGSVVSGNIVAGSDTASPSSWWNGELPLAIHSSPFDSKYFEGFTEIHGVSWTGSLTSSSINEAVLEGTFSVPRYIHGDGMTNFSVEWWRGQFSFQLRLLWNASVDDLILPGETLSSPIYFHGSGITNKSDMSYFNVNEPSYRTKDMKELIQFVSESDEDIGAARRVPIILQGMYSPDRSVFWWTGNVMLSFPAVKPGPPLSLVMTPLHKVTQSVGVTVESGSLSGAQDGETSTLWWSGSLPLDIPLPLLNSATSQSKGSDLSQSIFWNGTLLGNLAGGAVLQGQFSALRFTHANDSSGVSTQLWTGSFSFQLRLMWNASINGLVEPGTMYSSPIFFRSTVPSLYMNSKVFEFRNDSKGIPEIPIVLQGTFSPDRTYFRWTGNAVIAFPSAK